MRESRRVLTRDDKGLPSVAAKKTAWRHKAVSMRQMDYHGKQGASLCAALPLGAYHYYAASSHLDLQTFCLTSCSVSFPFPILGEADRRVLTKMPKHLYSGKRGAGSTDRR